MILRLPPANLRFDVVTLDDRKRHHVLRFDNTVWNAGPGRLELEGSKRSKIYQNLYDAPTGGVRVQQLYLGNDSVFHRSHSHYHFENFAAYLLLAKNTTGYEPTASQGTKTSFCIIDTTWQTGSHPKQYTLCDQVILPSVLRQDAKGRRPPCAGPLMAVSQGSFLRRGRRQVYTWRRVKMLCDRAR